jgi:hypothetical protein
VATYYVGSGGNDANDGLSWANRKLTLNGAEDVPVAAGDIVYVAPGTYRETLTCDVSGSAGNPITYIGDYSGANTDGTGGVVRVTGSDNDLTATRTNCITASSKNLRVFRGFLLDMVQVAVSVTNCATWTIEQCVISDVVGASSYGIFVDGASQAALTVRNCLFFNHTAAAFCMLYNHSATVDNAGHVVENCIMIGNPQGRLVSTSRVGGITIRNSYFIASTVAIRIGIALTAGQTVTVNNCIFNGNITALSATAVGEIVENYNAFYANTADRTNVNTGANSNAYPPLFDARWFFEAVGGGDLVTPFDLASYSQLINVAGTSPTTTDLRGTSVIGAQREWGALEYDSTLKIEAGSSTGGGRRPRIRWHGV